jgi:hypothetical protein
VRVFRLSQGSSGIRCGSLGKQILTFQGRVVSSISSDTSTPEEKDITLYRNVGIPLPVYAASYSRRYPELFLHRRYRLFGDEGLGSGIWRSLVALHTAINLPAKERK